MPFSQYLSTAVLDWFKGTSFPAAGSNLFISVHTADPGVSGTSADVTASIRGVAGRVSVSGSSFTAPTAGGGGFQIQNTNIIQITASAANGGTIRVTHFGIWSADSGGNFLCSGALTAGVDVLNGDTVQFNANALTIRSV